MHSIICALLLRVSLRVSQERESHLIFCVHNVALEQQSSRSDLCHHFFLQALAPHLEALRSTKEAKPAKMEGETGKGERALVEARLYLTGAVFKMDHHPMEVCLPIPTLFL